MDEYIIGLDIGSSKVCATAGKLDRNGMLSIIGVTSSNCNGVKRGIVLNIDNACDAIKSCIEKLEGMIDRKISNVVIDIPTAICSLDNNKGVVAIASEDKEIRRQDVERVKKAAKIISIPADKEIIDIIPEQYIIDGYDNISDPVGMSGSRLEIDARLVLSETNILNNLFKCINKAEIKVEDVVYQPLALANATLMPEEKAIGTALIDVGSESISITIFKDGKIRYVNCIPLGGNAITNDIAYCLKIPMLEAEKLKIKYASSGRGVLESNSVIKANVSGDKHIDIEYKYLVDIMQARIEEIIYLICEKLKDSGYYDEISSLVLVGGGIAFFTDIEDITRKITGKQTRIGTCEFVGASNPLYATSVGTIKSVVSKLNINEFKEAEEERDKEINWTRDKIEKKRDQGNFVSKIKEFFTEFF